MEVIALDEITKNESQSNNIIDVAYDSLLVKCTPFLYFCRQDLAVCGSNGRNFSIF